MSDTAPFEIQPDSDLLVFFKKIFDQDFMPHGHCFFWRSDILWLHVLSDIFLCGTTHVVNIYTTWFPAYRLEGFVKLLTAIVSIVTALMMIPLMPKAIAFPSIETLIKELSQKKGDLENVNRDLERFNQVAMGREERIMELKQEVNQLAKGLGKPVPYNVVS